MKGTELAAIRESLRLTQAELASLLDVATNTVSRWEQDQMPIRRRDELSVRFLATRNGKQWAKTATGLT
jgi:DNA-binding transcriptional regulator YiaG